MSHKKSVTYQFNSAITDVDKEDGSFDKEFHRRRILPLRGKIMQCDGVCGLNIDRYEMRVEYISGVTDPEAIDKIVEETIEWAAGESYLFPLRGNKKPQATREKPEPITPSKNQWVLVHFNTNVVSYPPAETSEKFDDEKFRSMTHSLANAMTNTDGVVGFQLRISSAGVEYDSEITSREAIEQHLKKVFAEAVGTENESMFSQAEFFPYLDKDSSKLVITFLEADE